MANHPREEAEAFGGDSFLDVVTNVVGILVILVFVVGTGYQQSAGTPAPQVAPEELARLNKEAAALESDVLNLTDQIKILETEAAIRHQERSQMALAVNVAQRLIGERRAALDAGRQAAFDIERQIASAQAHLNELTKQHERLEAAPTQTVEIKSYPTPISQSVEGEEAHFRLKGKVLAPIPLAALLERLKAEAKLNIDKLRNAPEYTSTIGPIGDFRLRYTMIRVDLAGDAGGHYGSYAQLAEWTLIPTAELRGETLDEALAQGSEFRDHIARLNPRRTTITIWIYPDSFAEFRKLKQVLFESGFDVAGRPLPNELPIGGSPDGSKSAAQ